MIMGTTNPRRNSQSSIASSSSEENAAVIAMDGPQNGMRMDHISQLRNQSTITPYSLDDTLPTLEENVEVVEGQAGDINWEIPRERLVITEEKLGGGAFGFVHKGVYSRTDGIEVSVAVKRLKGLLLLAALPFSLLHFTLFYHLQNFTR